VLTLRLALTAIRNRLQVLLEEWVVGVADHQETMRREKTEHLLIGAMLLVKCHNRLVVEVVVVKIVSAVNEVVIVPIEVFEKWWFFNC
jgi:hypothetical protein